MIKVKSHVLVSRNLLKDIVKLCEKGDSRCTNSFVELHQVSDIGDWHGLVACLDGMLLS